MAPGTVALLIKMIYDGMDEYFAHAILAFYRKYVSRETYFCKTHFTPDICNSFHVQKKSNSLWYT